MKANFIPVDLEKAKSIASKTFITNHSDTAPCLSFEHKKVTNDLTEILTYRSQVYGGVDVDIGVN